MLCYLENKTKTISTETKLTERNATITSHNHVFINFPKKTNEKGGLQTTTFSFILLVHHFFAVTT